VKHGVIKDGEMSLRLIEHDFRSGTSVDPPPKPHPSSQTLITNPGKWQLDSLPFNTDSYFDHLRSNHLGRTLLYTEVITTTQSLFTSNMAFSEALTQDMGVVNVAGQQTKGKGTTFNKICFRNFRH